MDSSLFGLLMNGGWLMVPIGLFGIVALGIIGERIYALQKSRVAPVSLVGEVWQWLKSNQLDQAKIKQLREHSSLGRILAVGILNAKHGREITKEAIVEVATHEIHEMQRFLNSLGSIAAITPLLGLLGTVIGMIEVFGQIVSHGAGDAGALAGGISKALITTASGLSVAIPALFFHRFFMRRIDELAIDMERDAIKLVDVLHQDREPEGSTAS